MQQPLKRSLSTYCDVNAMELVNEIPRINPAELALFKQQLANAINTGSISVAEYETLTGDEFENESELTQWLIELWEILFGCWRG
ncbi:hypothetical protein [Shewanella sp.]|uniref:hypothetical protein n=1 Tax=Shewanella sp. TaxID=50422 RepID=UPI003A983357